MKKLIFMLKRKDGLSSEEFRRLYEESHALMARKYVGHLLESYERNYTIAVNLPPTREEGATDSAPGVAFDWDVVTEMRLKDQAAVDELMRIFGDPEVGALFVEDEKRMFDRKAIVMVTCEEVSTGTALQPSG